MLYKFVMDAFATDLMDTESCGDYGRLAIVLLGEEILSSRSSQRSIGVKR